jgi:hypothetical protein
MFYRISLMLVVFASLGTGSALAQNTQPSSPPNIFEGTPEEQAACRRDSTTLCRDAVPDTFRVLACLQQNRQRISKACRQVLESHGQ